MILQTGWYGQILNPMEQEDVGFYADSMAAMDVHVLFHRTIDIYSYKNFSGPFVLKIVSDERLPVKIVHEIDGVEGIVHFFNTTITPRAVDAKKVRLKITPVYTGELLTGAIIEKPNKGGAALYYLHYKYDSRGRLMEERWEKLINGRRTLWLEVENRYFDAARDLSENQL